MKVLLEDKNKVVEIADNLSPQDTEKALRYFYTPEELYGATTFQEREGYRINKGRATVDTGKIGKKAATGQISYEAAKTMNNNIMKDFTPDNDAKYSAHNWPERFTGATTELAPYMLDSSIEAVKYGEYTGAGFAGVALVAGQAGPQVAIPEEIITVPVAWVMGRVVGQAYGAWKNASDVEGGSLYMTLREEGIEHNLARNFSEPAGGVIGLIELFSVGHIFNKFIPKFGKKAITDFIIKEAKKETSKAGSSLLTKIIKQPLVKTAGKVAGRTALEITEEQVQDNISFISEVGANLITAMQEENGVYNGPSYEDWVQTNKDTFTSSLLSFPMLMIPGATFDTIKTHGRENIAQRVMTQRAQEALNLDLADHIAEATKFNTYQEFRDSLGVTVNDKYANQYGFDNRTLFCEGVWKASRDVVGEDKVIEEIMKEEVSEQPEIKAEPPAPKAKGGEITVYHVAPRRSQESILTHGLDPSKAGYDISSSGKEAYVFKNLDEAKWYKNYQEQNPADDIYEKFDIYEVKVDPKKLKTDYGLTSDVDSETSSHSIKTPVKGIRLLDSKLSPKGEGATVEEGVASKRIAPKGEGGEPPAEPPIITKGEEEPPEEKGTSTWEEAPENKKSIKQLIRETTGQVKAGDLINEASAIKRLFQREAAMAKVGFREGQKQAETKAKVAREELKALQKEKEEKISALKERLVEFANQNLPKEDRGAFLNAVMKLRTEDQLDKQMARVQEVAEKAAKRALIRLIRQQVQRIQASKALSIDYVQKIMDFINDYETKGHSEDTIKSLEKTKEFLENEFKSGKNVEMPSYVLEALEILARKPLTELSLLDLQNISDKIKVMADLGKTKLRSRKAAEKLRKARDLKEIAKDSKAVNSRKIKEGNAIVGKLNAIDNLLNGVKKALNLAQIKDLMITPIDAIFDYLDNSKNYLGANYRIFKRRIDVAYSLYLNTVRDINNRVDSKANELKLDTDNMERIGLYAAREQEGGEEKLLSFFTQEQIDSVVLTDNEMEFYKFMRKELDNLRPQIEKVMREVYNQPLGNVKNYFPFMIDFEAMGDKEIRDRFGDKVTTHYDTFKKNVAMGFTENRVGGKNRIKLNAAEIFGLHVDNALYLINVGRETKYLGELAKTEEYGKAVGDVGQEIVREWIDLIARKGISQGNRIKTLDILRNYAGMIGLGFKLSSALVQITTLMDGAALIGPHAFMGFGNIVSSSEWRTFVMDNMPEVRTRIGDDPAFQDFKKKGFGKSLNDLAYAPLKTIDKFSATGVAAGVYIKYCEENGIVVDLTNPNPEAITYAQKMMRRTQASSQFKDLPLAISKGKLTGNISLDKVILQFQTFMLNRWSLIRHDLWRAGIKGTNKKQAINIAMWLIAANFAEIGIRKWTKEAIGQLMGKEPPEEDEDKELLRNIGQVLQNVPFMGSLYYAMIYEDYPIPSISMTAKIAKKITSAVKSDEDNSEVRWLKAFLSAMPGGQQIEQNIKEEE